MSGDKPVPEWIDILLGLIEEQKEGKDSSKTTTEKKPE